jgi:hypothetical protein
VGFREDMSAGYPADAAVLGVGRPVAGEGPPLTDVEVGVPLGMLNRHGLVAGATGTGKTKTLQVIAERASAAGCPVLAPDVKGDLAGLGAPGEGSERLLTRAAELACDWAPAAVPVELLSLTGARGVPVRASVSGFGPLLMAKVLDLNDTQESALSLVVRFCDEHDLDLVGLEDLRAALAWLAGPGKAGLGSLGGISSATIGVLQRKVTQLETEGGDLFFGAPPFAVDDLMRVAPDGRGVVSVLDLSDAFDRPALTSTFMMWLLAELFERLPEVGDPDRPALVFMIDEAHLLFADASTAFLNAVVQTVRLIRSKGVAVVFCTQMPSDLPEPVLAQLGHRVQHAVRAHTPKEARALREVVHTFPITAHYDVARTLQSLAVGDALVAPLDARGVPAPLALTRVYPPVSRMDPLSDAERAALVGASALRARYGERIDPMSAEEVLAARAAADLEREIRESEVAEVAERARRAERAGTPRRRADDDVLSGDLGELVSSRLGQTVTREVVRGLFGLLKRGR